MNHPVEFLPVRYLFMLKGCELLYIERVKKREKQYLQDMKKHITNLQEEGNYPLNFQLPLAIQYEITSKCNVNCLHCYNNSAGNASIDLMSHEKWLALSKEIVNYGGVFQCIISGGEPLTYGKKLFDVMDIFHEDNTGFVFITNGLLMDTDIIKRIKKYNFYWIQVSIDSSRQQQHDRFRQRKGSWDKAVQAAYLVSSAGLPLAIASSVTPENMYDLEEMIKLAYNSGASTIILGEVMLSGRAASNPQIFLNIEQKEYVLKKIEELTVKYQHQIQIQKSASTWLQLNSSINYPNRAAIIRPNGDVRIDCSAPFVIGNVLEKPFAEIWNQNGKYAWSNEKVLNYLMGLNELTEEHESIVNYVSEVIYL